jgi:VanZ family protein
MARNIFEKFLGTICLFTTAGILLVGFWPFNFLPKNKVEWLKEQNGLQFFGQAIVFSEASIPDTQPPTPSNLTPFSIEIWLQPGKESYDYAARILSFYGQQRAENMTLSQWKSTLIVQGRLQNRHPESYSKVGVKDALLKGVKRFITITSGPEGARLYIDGKLTGNHPKFNLFLGNGGNIGQLLLGNSPKGNQCWTGNLLGLAIYNQSLTEEKVLRSFENWEKNKKSAPPKEEGVVSCYLFDERSGTLAHDHAGGHHLIIPSRFEVLQKTILVPPWKDITLSRSYFMDILTNILGFIPFGFFFSAYLSLRRQCSTFQIFLVSVLFAACISVSIELIQVFLPTRTSQLTDTTTNIVGTSIGVFLFLKTRKA